jgi:hypothetical protein
MGDLAEAAGCNRWGPDKEHATGVAVVAVLDDRDVDVEDIAGL